MDPATEDLLFMGMECETSGIEAYNTVRDMENLDTEAAVDRNDSARYISCPSEEQRRTRDVLSLPEACCRDSFPVALDNLLVQCRGHVGLDEPGGDHVGGDVPASQFAGEAAGHADQRRLGGRVVDLPG